MDVRKLDYPDSSFDIAIDKSTMDALLCGENSFLNVAIMTKEVQRVLKNDGVYMVISYGQPENRVLHLEREHLSLDLNVFTIKKNYHIDEEDDSQQYEKIHYVYLCRKRDDADEVSKAYFQKVYDDLEKQEKFEEKFNNFYDEEEFDPQIENLHIINDENLCENKDKKETNINNFNK
jgi:ubiquinone/menaquinone biosynthesis C-methylase UbiE